MTREDVANALVEPALVLAFEVACADPAAAPTRLRPLLHFSRTNRKALAVIRRTLDEDDAFRARVAEADSMQGADESLHASWLYLHRPEGWEEELRRLEQRAESDEEAKEDERATVRLRRAEATLREMEAANAALRAAAREAGERLRAAQAARAEAEAAVAATAAAAEDASTQARDARRRADRAAAELGALRARVAELEAALAEVSAARDEALARLAAPPPPAASASDPVAHERTVEQAAEQSVEPAVEQAVEQPPVEQPPVDGPWRDPAATGRPPADVAAGVAAAAAAARALADALAVTAAALDVGAPSPSAPPPAAPPRPARPPRSDDVRRRPASLPPAVFEDSREAAEHLVRLPGALLLVDGYNAVLALRPSLSLAERRSRLVDALGELSARTGIDVHVVFDGGADAEPARPPAGPTRVRTTFTRAEVEADDLILDLLDDLPPSRPVVVASNDRRVQSGARRRGANVLSVDQLLAVLRRQRG